MWILIHSTYIFQYFSYFATFKHFNFAMKIQLNSCFRHIDLMVKDDLERKLLRSQLDQKGKVRLGRIFGALP